MQLVGTWDPFLEFQLVGTLDQFLEMLLMGALDQFLATGLPHMMSLTLIFLTMLFNTLCLLEHGPPDTCRLHEA